MTQILELSGADVRYFGGVGPPRLLRIAADEDGVLAYSAEPSWPTWEADFEVFFDLAKGLDETIFEITKAEAIFLLHNWGGQHDGLDHPEGPEEREPRRFLEEEKDLNIGLAREDALRELRGLGTRVNVVPPLIDSPPPPPPAQEAGAIDRSA